MAKANLSLISNANRIEVPFIKVVIGQYTFGIYQESKGKGETNSLKLKYPNYVKSLNITKINGQVNQYDLTLEYTVTEYNDPNFFEKVFSSVSQSRTIIFSYGDLFAPYYAYRDEKAIITDVKSDFDIASSKIAYKVKAVSSTKILSYAVSTFGYFPNEQPSNIIKSLLKSEAFGLLEVFYGMRNGLTLNGVDLIPSNDLPRTIEAKENINVLDYLRYLVDLMTPVDSEALLKGGVYTLIFSDDVSNDLGGPYFQIVQAQTNMEMSDAYEIDIGYESKDIVMDFHIDNDESYSIYYNYCNELEDTQYVRRYNSRGELEEVYAPILSSGNAQHKTQENDKSWWTKVTSFPIGASITLKGLLRPAMLVTHVRINIYFYGKKHISSGLYIVTKEEDTVNEQGFKTKLNLIRISGDRYSE